MQCRLPVPSTGSPRPGCYRAPLGKAVRRYWEEYVPRMPLLCISKVAGCGQGYSGDIDNGDAGSQHFRLLYDQVPIEVTRRSGFYNAAILGGHASHGRVRVSYRTPGVNHCYRACYRACLCYVYRKLPTAGNAILVTLTTAMRAANICDFYMTKY